MVDFSNLEKKKTSADTKARYDLYEVGMGHLMVSPATRSNKPYNAALLKLMLPQQRRIQGGKINADFVEKYRADLVPLYAKFIVKAWEGIFDSKGNEVPFSQDNVAAFLGALPLQVFDNLVDFCENELNFMDLDPEGAAKN